MKLRKLFAWLMTLVMLLGMVPAGHAEGGNITPGGNITVSCNHNWDWRFPNGEPTHCQEERLMEMYCTLCGQVASSYPVTGDHTPGSWQWDGTPPANCYEWGIQNQSCSVCGEVFNEREVQGEHQWSAYVTETPAGCEAPGEEVSYCTVCGERGNAREIPPAGHDWGDWQMEVEPTCTEEGLRVSYCKRCNMRYEDYLTPNGHQWGDYVVDTPAGCETPGEEISYCTVCGARGDVREIPPAGHDWGNWQMEVEPTCTEEGLRVSYCKRCNMRYEDYLTPNGHQWGDWKVVTAGTCCTPAKEQRTCSVCGAVENRNGDYGGHSWSGWVTDKAATCTEGGTEKNTCAWCGKTQSRETDPLGHQYGSWKVERASICTEKGLVYKQCSRCGDTQWLYTDPTGHSMGDWYVFEEPQIALPGIERSDCLNECGYFETREIPALEQEFVPVMPTIVKEIVNAPANGEAFVVGETIVYRVTLVNDTGLGLVAVSLYDPLYAEPVDVTDTESTLAIAPRLAAGESVSGEFSYVVTEEDVLAGKVVNVANATFAFVDDPDIMLYRDYSNTLVTPVGGTLSADGLELTLVLSSTPANGTHFVVGEEVVFTETWVNNTDQTLYPFSVSIFTCAAPTYGSEVDQICSWFAEDYGGPVAPGATNSHTLTVTVTEADVARGAIYAMAELLSTVQDGPDLETIHTDFVTAPCGEDKLPEVSNPPADDNNGDGIPNGDNDNNDGNDDTGLADAPEVMVVKSLHNTPANGTYYVPGEWIHFLIQVNNNAGEDLTGVVLTDPLVDKTFEYDLIPANDFAASVVSYQVTEQDASTGSVENYARVRVYTGDGYYDLTSNSVTAPCGFPGEDDPAPDSTVTSDVAVIKTVLSTPDNGMYYVPGEEIRFFIVVQNNMDKMLDCVVLTDPLDAYFYFESTPIPAGDSVSRPLNYVVTELDAEIGSVTNYAYAVAYVDGKPSSLTSNAVTVPCGFPDKDGDDQSDDPFGTFDSIAVVKTEESLPMNGQYYTEGEVIHYTITYTNDGEQTLTDVEIWDALDISAPIASAEMLTPGESRVCYYQHTVTAADVAYGSVMNMAIASYPVPGGEGYATSYSNMVISDTDGQSDPEIVPDGDADGDGIPNGSDPDVDGDGTPNESDPDVDGDGTPNGSDPDVDGDGTPNGSDPDVDGDGTPNESDPDADGDGIPNESDPDADGSTATPGGTIDTDKLHSSGDHCVRTIVSRDNASVSYEISFCSTHTAIQSSVLMMTQAATTPEAQTQAATYAVTLWRAEVEKLYQEIYGAADPLAKVTVMKEYVCFVTDMANYEAMLKQLYPDQPALVAQKVAAMWENKCVSLCYEMHTDAADRKDSLLAVTPATGATAVACTCVNASETNGKKTCTQSFCSTHSFPYSMIDILLQGNDTTEAWTMVRQIWTVELTSAYNKLAAKLGAYSGLAMAEYNILTQWLNAQEAALTALYPDNPEVVAQAMVKLIMERVNNLCQMVN